MSWYRAAQYASEIGGLNRYLRSGFDPWDYTHELEKYLQGFGEWADMDYETWLEKATPEDISDFRKYIENRKPGRDIDTDKPAYEHLAYEKFVTPTWLVHFTFDAKDIGDNGFRFGFPETRGLGLTTWFTDEVRKKEPGFNFAFEANSRDARSAARDQRYGDDAVIFWGAGVQGYHDGDSESQIIFWGPSINREMIFPIYQDSKGVWECRNGDGRVIVGGRDFEWIVQWVINNRAMLRKALDKI